MKIICKCSSQHSPLYSVEALPNFRFFVCLAVRWILVVLPTVYYSLSKPIRQNCALKRMRFFWDFQPQCIKNSFTFQDILQQEKAIFIRWNIELSIILVNDWISKRVVLFEVVSCILSSYSKAWVQVAFQFIGMKYLLCRAEQSARKWCREGVVKLEKSLNFLSSLEWQLSLFLLMLGVRVASEASESAAAVEAVFYGRSSRFPTDVNSRLSNHGELRSTRLSSAAAAVKSTSLARRKRERELNFTCVRVYILWNWNSGS